MSRLADIKYDVVKRYYYDEIYQADLRLLAKFCYILGPVGPQLNIEDLDFEFDTSTKDLCEAYLNRVEEEYKRDLQRVSAWYSENGYPDARVVDSTVQLSEDRASMYITLKVEEGEYIRAFVKQNKEDTSILLVYLLNNYFPFPPPPGSSNQ